MSGVSTHWKWAASFCRFTMVPAGASMFEHPKAAREESDVYNAPHFILLRLLQVYCNRIILAVCSGCSFEI